MMRASTSSRARSLFARPAVLVALVFAAAGCSSASEVAADAPDVATTEALVEANGHQFGVSLEDFDGSTSERPASSPPPEGYTEISWDDLVPPGFSGAEISARFDERIAQVEPGSPEADEVFAELQAEYDNQPVNPELAGDDIQLAGFVAPLTYSGDLITEFLLVPYFGACIHVPPPPVNQTVMVTLQDGEGLTIDESWGPVWVTGTMAIDGATTDLATAGYSISGAQTGVYDDY